MSYQTDQNIFKGKIKTFPPKKTLLLYNLPYFINIIILKSFAEFS